MPRQLVLPRLWPRPVTEPGFLCSWGSYLPFRTITSFLAVSPGLLAEVCSPLLLQFLPRCRNASQVTDPAATPGEVSVLWGGCSWERSKGWVTTGTRSSPEPLATE